MLDLDLIGVLDGAMGDNRPYILDDIAAIEAEAASRERERLAAAVQTLTDADGWEDMPDVSRAAVLALLASPAQPGERE